MTDQDKINFLKKEPFYIFEIDNFLNNNLYLGLKDNFPLINKNMSLNDINALKIFENQTLKTVISNLSDRYSLHEDFLREIIFNEINKIENR